MMADLGRGWSRRRFLGIAGAAGAAGATGLLGPWAGRAHAEPPPETTTIRLPRYPFDVACTAPQWMAEEFLRAEGFTNVQYVQTPTATVALGKGALDIIIADAPSLILRLDAGDPLTLLAGIHGGCYELIGTGAVRAIRDLKDRTVAVANAGRHAFVATIVKYVGLDPARDLTFVTLPPREAMERLGEGKVDALLGFPPEPQELRARKIGHTVVNTGADRPWSHYFCCLAVGNREFVRAHPVAVKRALRALVRATDLCATDPERVARVVAERGYVKSAEHALQAFREIPYNRWRQYDSADTVRFFALRMHEAGVIKSSPKKIIAEGTDWRFVNALKQELKG